MVKGTSGNWWFQVLSYCFGFEQSKGKAKLEPAHLWPGWEFEKQLKTACLKIVNKINNQALNPLT